MLNLGLKPKVLTGGMNMLSASSNRAATWLAMKPPKPGTMTQSLFKSNISICLSNSITCAKLVIFI